MNDPQKSWCCGPQDCEPVPGRVSFDGRAWRVRGLTGSKAPGDRGFYWGAPDRQPWACRDLATNALRCLILPRLEI